MHYENGGDEMKNTVITIYPVEQGYELYISEVGGKEIHKMFDNESSLKSYIITYLVEE